MNELTEVNENKLKINRK